MTQLANQRCALHANREAVAVCLGCNRFFCRECVTEHGDRVLCASCLPLSSNDKKHQAILSYMITAGLFVGSILFLWFVFYSGGQILLKFPSSFHEGSLWQELWEKI